MYSLTNWGEIDRKTVERCFSGIEAMYLIMTMNGGIMNSFSAFSIYGDKYLYSVLM